MVLYTVYITQLLFVIANFVQAQQTEEKCNFIDNNIQPTFKLLCKTLKIHSDTKGDAGKIGVIGGSTEYTGAPYFAAITALKAGADLVYVITTEDASPVIKSYSPDIIVYPFLNTKSASKIRNLLNKMDVIVIGPGLGRDEDKMRLLYDIIADCKTLGKPLIIDADGLYAISINSSVLKDYPCPGVIMTPNQREADRLMKSVTSNSSNWYTYWGPCVSVLVKGEKDHFYSNTSAYSWSATGGGSSRRVAGQGDMLAGALGTFYNWALKTELCNNENNTQVAQSFATYAAAKFTRLCNANTFIRFGYNMVTSDMIEAIHPSFESIFLDN